MGSECTLKINSLLPNPPTDGTKTTSNEKYEAKDAEHRKAHILTIPRMHQGLAKRVLVNNSRSFMSAIKLKCLDCVGFEDPFVRIGKCRCVLCPLHHLRPYRGGNDEAAE